MLRRSARVASLASLPAEPHSSKDRGRGGPYAGLHDPSLGAGRRGSASPPSARLEVATHSGAGSPHPAEPPSGADDCPLTRPALEHARPALTKLLSTFSRQRGARVAENARWLASRFARPGRPPRRAVEPLDELAVVQPRALVPA